MNDGHFCLVRPHHRESATAFDARLRAKGFENFPIGAANLYCRGCTPVVAASGGCMVLGRAFWSDRDQPLASTDSVGRRRLDRVEAGTCCSELWGPFLFVRAGRDGDCDVVRDPSGALPAYSARTASGDLVVSDLQTLASATGARPGINWDGVAHHLRFSQFRGAITALAGVEEIEPGCRLRLAERAQRLVWSIPGDDDASAFEDHVRRLRRAILRSVRALGRDAESVIVELSGGLDSSIVAAAAAATGQRARALTFAIADSAADERHHARQVAHATGLALREVLGGGRGWRPSASLDVRPPRHGLLGGIDAALGEAASELGPGQVWTGAGGDTVFGALASPSPVLDALAARRPAAALAAVRDLALSRRVSRWAVARSAWRRAMRAPRSAWPPDDTLLGEARPRFAGHSWLAATADRRPGKRAHVAGILSIMPHLDASERARARPFVAPLMAQPVLEASIATPSWLLTRDGRDRAVARAAFVGELPAAILARRGKGQFDVALNAAYEQSRNALRTLLLEGFLVRERLVDRDGLEVALARSLDRNGELVTRIGDFADVESWLQALHA